MTSSKGFIPGLYMEEIMLKGNSDTFTFGIDDTAKGARTRFQELFTVILCASKISNGYLKSFGSQIKNEIFLKVKEALL